MNWLVVVIVLLLAQREYMASPTPLKLPGHTSRLTPYIRHWEAADYDRASLDAAHQRHIEQKHQRRKRALDAHEFGQAHTIRLKFNAHDREFRLVLRQDPLSVFASDVQIENTHGPVDYDISRIYTGSLEDDDQSHVHAVLTSDNLLDGSIETNSGHFYVEPSHRYSRDLFDSGVHSIVYKLSDVNMEDFKAATDPEHCASDRLRRALWQSGAYAMNNATIKLQRRKRWLPDEFHAGSSDNHQYPPLPLDLDTPYNDDFNTYSHINNRKPVNKPIIATTTTTAATTSRTTTTTTIRATTKYENNIQHESVITWRNNGAGNIIASTTNTNANVNAGNNGDIYRGSIVTPAVSTATMKTNYNLNRDNYYSNNRNYNNNNNNNGRNNDDFNTNINNNNNNDNYNNNNNNANNGNGGQNTYIRHKNIYLKNIYRNNSNNSNSNSNGNSNSNSNSQSTPYEQNTHASRPPYNYNGVRDYSNPFGNTNYNSNTDTNTNTNTNNNNNNNGTTRFISNDRPIHKTHVEIITKNGATKKPNIIVNNYNPDIILAPNPNFKSMTNLLIGRGQEAPQETTDSTTKSVFDRKITCMLYLQADHTFFQKMGSDEASIEAITRHVQRANSIYKNTDFNRDGKPDNITFMIKRIKVHNMNAVNDPTYRFPGNYGVEKFLELFSEEDYDAFCLAYMFTYRDFEMGTLGLAWTGDLKNAGGVCEKNGHYRGSLKSLNTGIVTLLNYGKHVPPAVSHVTLAHEIGHNFGSPHDPDQCTPGGEDGNFIMFARATSGDKKNNHKFSPCSLKSIDPVLSAKARSMKGCFTEPQTSICGNGVVEQGEQCDCGWEEDCKDTCCFPMSRHYRSDEKPCTLTPSAMCSPSQGPCCTTECKLKFGDKCRDDNGCRDPSFCDGRMPQCPPSLNKPNKTICNKEFVCYMGDCTGSICLAYGLESCQCIPGPQDNKIKSCELCCKLPGEGNPCRSSFEWNEPPFDVPDMYAKPGTPCNEYNGYCDVFQKCREVDPSGPLATLRKLLLSEESIATFKKWLQQNWYTVAFAIFGVLLLLILSTKLLAKRSNLKLKSVTIIHSATTETVRLPDDNNDVIVHTAVRTKVPFKKKVRGERVSSSSKAKQSVNNGGKKLKSSRTAGKTTKTTTATAAAVLASAGHHGRAAKVLSGAMPTVVTVASGREAKKASVAMRNSKKNRANEKNNATTTTVAAAVAGTALVLTAKPSNDAAKVELTSPGGSESKKAKAKATKKQRSSSKEVIDYSANNSGYTNTFSKVQKWLLESPIVAQPLSRIEHSTKMMSKSQSTPERLLQKSPQKYKSTGNVSKEKVKLQVVYKPPFKFALRMSKNAKIKTHVVSGGAAGAGGGGAGNVKRYFKAVGAAAAANEGRRPNRLKSNSADGGGVVVEHKPLPLRTNSKEAAENQMLNVLSPPSEPNYETLNPKQQPSTVVNKSESPLYENSRMTADGNLNRASRNSSKTNAEANASIRATSNSSRPNSLSVGSSSQFAALSRGSLRKPVATDGNINSDFSSTQNLIHGSPGELAKTKRRSGLLKLHATAAKSGKDPPTATAAAFQVVKRSSSNNNLRRDASATSIERSSVNAAPLRRNSSSAATQQMQKLPTTTTAAAAVASTSGSAVITSASAPACNVAAVCGGGGGVDQLLSYPLPRSSRSNNFSNIPRVSISSNSPASSNNSVSNFSFNAPSPLPLSATNNSNFTNHKNKNNNSSKSNSNSNSNLIATNEESRRTRNSAMTASAGLGGGGGGASGQRVNSIRQRLHNHHPPPLPAHAPSTLTAPTTSDADRETLASDLEVMVSDEQSLVS